ncbi:MAG TPA: lysylphosphatidylglycerol synthase transmembrane domain-containing protein [Anaerolineae bacterium]|nr:lysylphosphatidylglycerol synthase transmembrane domain-containing protein [Anaerolineae bacterium]
MWRKPQVWLGVLVSIVALYLAFRDVNWNEVGKSLADAQYIWLLPAALALIVAIWMRGERWRWLFGTQRDNLPRARYFNATAIGYLVSNTFPLRLGELARLFFIARDKKQTYGMAASTIVVEHVLDVLVVLGILIVIVLNGSLPVPDWAREGALISGVLFGGVLIAMLIMAWQRRRVLQLAEAVISKVPGLNRFRIVGFVKHVFDKIGVLSKIPPFDAPKWVGVVEHVLDGFAVLQPGLPLIMVLFWSIAGWLCSALTLYLGLKAFVPDAPFTYSLFTTVVTTFVLLLPATPSGLGPMQLGIQQALVAFSVNTNVATSFAIVFHLMEIVVMDALGLVCLLREAGSWAKARESLRSVTAQAEPQPETTAISGEKV